MRRKKIFSILMATVICTSLLSTVSVKANNTVKIDPNAKQQEIEGWGTALVWWANVIGGWSDSYQNEMVNLLYDAEDGLGFNIARYNVGGGEDPTKCPHGDHLRPGGNVESYLSEDGTWDVNADETQRNILLKAVAEGADVLEIFSNSPPQWMTESGCTAGKKTGGIIPVATENLSPKNYQAFADYLVGVTKIFKEQYGIEFDTLSPINEPLGPWMEGNGQEGAKWSRAVQNNILKIVGKTLEKEGLNTELSGPEENTVGETVGSYNSYDSETKELLGVINTHSYGPRETKRGELKNLAAKENKKLWMSEYGVGGDWREGATDHDHEGMYWPLKLAKNITKDINELGAEAWVYWQAIENEAAGNPNDPKDNGHMWGFIHTDLEGQDAPYDITKQYYVMGNYSKFIKPGYQILNSASQDTVVAYSKENNELVLVTYNDTKEDKTNTFDLSSFNTSGNKAEVIRTSKTEKWEQVEGIDIVDGKLNVVNKAESVTTYVIKNVTSAK